MQHQPPLYEVKVRIPERKDLEDLLDQAVEEAIREAMKHPGCGVLVTRHTAQGFTVELSGEVQQGTISECDARP